MRHKQLLLGLLIVLLPALRARATIYTVKTGGGGNYASIQSCAREAEAGDTCVVYAGTYDETPSLRNSGAAGKPITFSVNAGDCVKVTGFDLNSVSYVTLGTPNAPRCTNGSFAYSGFEITGGQITWREINNVIIQNNYVHHTSGLCMKGPGRSFWGASTYVYVLNNIFTVCGTLGAGLQGVMQIEGNHWLIDGNTLSHVEDGIYLYGAYMVVRNNTFGPLLSTDYTTQHPDGVESTCTHGRDYPLQHMLYESNTTIDWGASNAHAFLLRDPESCGQTSNVIRFSQFINLGENWISNESNSTSELIYNNSVENTQASANAKEFSDLTFSQGDTGANVINNVIVNGWRAGQNDYCIYVDGTSQTGFLENHNLCFLSGWNGSWQQPYGGYTYSRTDIFNKDPRFVNAAADLHLQAGSPAVGAGGPLTAAVGAGTSSASLTVANAGFFSDGYGLTGVQPDWIRIGASTTVQISSVNYSTNVLTLASPVSWTSGTPVYIYKISSGAVVLNGANPDIGAFPFGSAPGNRSEASPQPPASIQASAR
jgi:hypothetical protein